MTEGSFPPDEVTRAVIEELSQPKYRLTEPWWTKVLDFLERLWVRFVEWLEAVSEAVGGPAVMALLIGLAVVGLAAVVTVHLGKRRARRVDRRLRQEFERSRGMDPADLERRAAEAEHSGDYELAFRLRFQAALVRLDRAELIDLRPGSTSGTVVDELGSPAFAALAERFDAVVYGDREARASDPEAVRDFLDETLGVHR